MTTSYDGVQFIKKFEGFSKVAYKCPAGVWTIGYGHTDEVTKGMIIDIEKATSYLLSDIEKCEYSLDRVCSENQLSLTQNQYDALISFTFNCGEGNLRKLVKNRSVEEIGDALKLYNKANGVTIPGLVNRRHEEELLFKKCSRYVMQFTPKSEIIYSAPGGYAINDIYSTECIILHHVEKYEGSYWASTSEGWLELWGDEDFV